MEAKVKNIVNNFLDCAVKATNDFLNDKPIDKDGLYAIGDAVRILHHLKTMGLLKDCGLKPQDSNPLIEK